MTLSKPELENFYFFTPVVDLFGELGSKISKLSDFFETRSGGFSGSEKPILRVSARSDVGNMANETPIEI